MYSPLLCFIFDTTLDLANIIFRHEGGFAHLFDPQLGQSWVWWLITSITKIVLELYHYVVIVVTGMLPTESLHSYYLENWERREENHCQPV
jgi:hypothetical protein